MNEKDIIGTWRLKTMVGRDGKETTFTDTDNWTELTFTMGGIVLGRYQNKGQIHNDEQQKWNFNTVAITVNSFGKPFYIVTAINENELVLKFLTTDNYSKFKRIK